MRFCLLSWNVHKCIGGLDRRYDPARIAAVIAHAQPQLVLLQEVAQQGRRFRGERQVDVLGDLLGFPHRSYFVNVRFGPHRGEYGNAILSQFPITATENVDLTLDGRKARSVLHAEIQLPVDEGRTRTLHAFDLHLGLSERERREQLRRFLQCAPLHRVQARTPVVVAGDFNDVWGSLGQRLLEPAGFTGAPRRLRTFPAFAPLRALDSIYVRGEVVLHGTHTLRTALTARASDHLPLVTTLQLQPTT